MFLLDTNVVSEFVRAKPDATVLAYIRALTDTEVFTAAICQAEIYYGLARMPTGRRRNELAGRIAEFFDVVLQDKVLPFDGFCAGHYGQIRTNREAKGKPICVQDAMIAATAFAHGATLLTRNTRDFDDCEIPVVNPWIVFPD